MREGGRERGGSRTRLASGSLRRSGGRRVGENEGRTGASAHVACRGSGCSGVEQRANCNDAGVGARISALEDAQGMNGTQRRPKT